MLEQALDRMPHRGAMRLIGEITDADDTMIACIAKDHRGADYPLRLDGVLYAASLVELGAQAAAAHTSIYGTGTPHTGLILSMGKVEMYCDQVPDDSVLDVRARRTMTLDMAAGYRFDVMMNGQTLVSGDVLLSMQHRP